MSASTDAPSDVTAHFAVELAERVARDANLVAEVTWVASAPRWAHSQAQAELCRALGVARARGAPARGRAALGLTFSPAYKRAFHTRRERLFVQLMTARGLGVEPGD